MDFFFFDVSVAGAVGIFVPIHKTKKAFMKREELSKKEAALESTVNIESYNTYI